MIEGFFLPDPSVARESFIDQTCRMAFDCPHDLMQRIDSLPYDIRQGRENQVRVVGHDHHHVQAEFLVVSIDARVQDNLSCRVGQLATIFGHKCDQVRSVITLVVRQVAPVEAHLFIVNEGSPPEAEADLSFS